MEIILTTYQKKIIDKNDVELIDGGVCFKNESYAFQAFLSADCNENSKINVQSDLKVNIYQVLNVKGKYAFHEKSDDFYIEAPNDMYPDILRKTDFVNLQKGENAVLFFEINADEKPVGIHEIKIEINGANAIFKLEVLDAVLEKTDLLLTNWVHCDCICNYYGVKPFTKEFYCWFKSFLSEYVKMGNNMLLTPLFTPPLDTQVGGERLTTQLVGVVKKGENYTFDFSKLKEFIEFAKTMGIEYFEFSHLFTQWGGKFAPKIIAEVNGAEERIFGWETASDDEKYLEFLKQFLENLNKFVIENELKGKVFIHLTDEPHGDHIELYQKLSNFVRAHNGGIPIMDALSNYEFQKRGVVDLPALGMNSVDYDKFNSENRLLYYCVDVCENCLTNRYLHMPLWRTQVLGIQLYMENARGFLHWGYNFYNAQFSVKAINPYEETMAGGNFASGDSFIVYPGKDGVEYSLRYYAMLRAFEDYRLLKTAEKKVGRENVIKMIKESGFRGLHEYPLNIKNYELLREKIQETIKTFA